MKANELRLGNIILLDNCQERIDSITENILSVEGMNGCYSISEIKPISLTEQWLIDFGFHYLKTMEGYKIYELNNIRLSIYMSNDKNGAWLSVYRGTIIVKFIHQLQNLYYALTGEKLTKINEL